MEEYARLGQVIRDCLYSFCIIALCNQDPSARIRKLVAQEFAFESGIDRNTHRPNSGNRIKQQDAIEAIVQHRAYTVTLSNSQIGQSARKAKAFTIHTCVVDCLSFELKGAAVRVALYRPA